jgi:hypothetical protein
MRGSIKQTRAPVMRALMSESEEKFFRIEE